MAFKATRYFVLIVALVLAGTRYMNTQRKRTNVNNEIGVWDSKAKDGRRFTVVTRSNETDGQFFLVHAYCTAKAEFGGIGRVNPMQLVLLFAEYDMTLAELPPQLWAAARKFLVPLARLLGFRSRYSEYVSKAGQPLPVELTAAAAPAVEVPATAAAAAVEKVSESGGGLEDVAAAVEVEVDVGEEEEERRKIEL
ncbi:hypothetical protein VOLCADRAFT_97969 [Volvox carteri f. nagariensis]|uniref:Uncharacterized protein n=1 Tax=Volvox carteri f. nagariensis TaxID=3068 RepID=D8UE39_VOLCA|nr:uncharacterized protein VOLCADRAFT_97969 [Volvox carteri f. nagariensis]EFJ42059.1 hypothetical protein VOLCADRAFT_97969 [Volvox carteri f. nagariensis]|eukprot:XP_002956934.1 hypothetical protein VOLCADRAFT_97969 [Volvox carteri f. nagariensis]